jgi:hypothetical protein
MMKGPKLRGISYRIAMGHMSEQRYERAIKEFLQYLYMSLMLRCVNLWLDVI